MVEEKKTTTKSTIKRSTKSVSPIVKEKVESSVCKIINLRNCPVFSDVTKSNIAPGKEGTLSKKLADTFKDKGYVKIT